MNRNSTETQAADSIDSQASLTQQGLEILNDALKTPAAKPQEQNDAPGLVLSAEEVSDLHSSRELVQLLRSKNIKVVRVRVPWCAR